jgi:hypothetical protein
MNSIFNDYNFLLALDKANMNKFAQEVDPYQVLETASKMTNKLYSNNYGISSEENTELTSNHIENINTLLQWLLNNKIKSNGLQIAITGAEANDIELDDNKYVGPIDVSGQQVSIYKDGLVAFLKQMRANAAQSQDTLAKERASSLIEQVNSDKRFGIEQMHTEESPATQTQIKPEQQTTQTQQQTQQQNQQATTPSRAAPVKFNFTAPFDTATNDVISINRISRFLSELIETVKNVSQTAAELGPEQASIANTAGQLMSALNAWLSSAPNSVKIQNGFILQGGLNFNLDTFLMTYADNNPLVGLSLISKLLPIFNQLWSLLKMIKVSPTLLENFGKDTIESQERIVSSYVQQFNAIIQQLKRAQ